MRTEDKENRTVLKNRQLYWPVIAIAAVIAVFAVSLGRPISRVEAGPEATVDVVVHKSSACGCCSLWINQLQAGGLDVEVVNVTSTDGIRESLNVPNTARSCHTARVGDYWVEGHVPADLVAYLIEKKPSYIKGLAVPGMVIGSPGMEGPNPVDYDVIAYNTDGTAHVFARRKGEASGQ